jgi:quercetin dioxygenase-like cupin family protein
MGVWGTDGWAVRAGEGTRVDASPHRLEVLVRGAEVDGALGAFVFTHQKITEALPHAHLDFAKVLYVLDGEYHFRVGGAVFDGGPGTLVVVPRGSHHAFTTATGGRVLFVCSPSGNEEMFLELGKLGPCASEEQREGVRGRFGTVGVPGEPGRLWGPPTEH